MPAPVPSPTPTFARLWRVLLPAGLAIVAVALLFGLFDTTGRPVWIFAVGVLVTAVGLASLVHLAVLKSRAAARALEEKIDEEFGSKTP